MGLWDTSLSWFCRDRLTSTCIANAAFTAIAYDQCSRNMQAAAAFTETTCNASYNALHTGHEPKSWRVTWFPVTQCCQSVHRDQLLYHVKHAVLDRHAWHLAEQQQLLRSTASFTALAPDCRLRRLPLWSLKSLNFSFLFLSFFTALQAAENADYSMMTQTQRIWQH